MTNKGYVLIESKIFWKKYRNTAVEVVTVGAQNRDVRETPVPP